MVTVQWLQKVGMMLPDEQTLRAIVRPDFFPRPVDWVRIDSTTPSQLRERAKIIAA